MLDEKLEQLQRAARKHSEPLAIWVVYALSHYFHDGATALFQRKFEAYPTANYDYLISYCMKRDRSDDGIIKSISKLIS